MTLANSIIDYISKNKEWLFSGAGVTIVVTIFWLIRHSIFGKRDLSANGIQSKSKDDDDGPNYWDAITPSNSNYKLVSEKSNSFPAGVQAFSFEYSPQGHANALNLKGKIVRVEIQFSCQLSNVYKAMFAANDYALNYLQPQFLIDARTVLEKYSASNLRNKRKEIADEIVLELSDMFDKFGFKLLSVNIGAIEQINSPNKYNSRI